MTEMKPMKEGLNDKAIKRIGHSIQAVHSAFNLKGFIRDANKGLQDLELKERVKHLIAVLHTHLPKRFDQQAKVLADLPEVWDFGDPNDSTKGFAAWPVIDYVAEYGLDHPKISLDLLEKLTHLFSAEFAIRPFIIEHNVMTYAKLQEWCSHPREHVRRLVSEGCRPRLPWGQQLKQYIVDPAPIFPLLDELRFDHSDYVRKSVANNLNDISKDHPALLLDYLADWQLKDQGKTEWIIKHAARSLIKQGHPDSFALLGYTQKPKIKCELTKVDDLVNLESELEFNCILSCLKNKQKFVLDYGLYLLRANGQHNLKVFKLKNMEMNKGEQINITKSHSFKTVTTRKYYPGAHSLVLLVNGVEVAKKNFELV